MICRSCYAPVRDLKWSSHTQELCSERRSQLLRHEHAEICRNHPRGQAPALLLGRICPLCSPDILVKTVEADQLRALGLNNVGMRIDTNAIYRVNENSQVCNFLDAENCPDIECPCKRQKRGHNALTRKFWSDYNRNAKHAFDHSTPFKPYGTEESLDQDDDDGPHSTPPPSDE